MSKVLLLSGKQGSGKTTIAKTITKLWFDRKGKMVVEVPFAQTLYEMHDFLLSLMDTYGFKRDIVKDGPLLQFLGTDWGRKNFGENVWIDILKKKIANLETKYDWADLLVIVPDCRFKNEFDAFPNALRIRLECDRELRKKRCSAWRENENHASEIDLDEYVKLRKFDDTYDTGDLTISFCSDRILRQIDEKWKHLL